jgi:hypothetical protein
VPTPQPAASAQEPVVEPAPAPELRSEFEPEHEPEPEPVLEHDPVEPAEEPPAEPEPKREETREIGAVSVAPAFLHEPELSAPIDEPTTFAPEPEPQGVEASEEDEQPGWPPLQRVARGGSSFDWGD